MERRKRRMYKGMRKKRYEKRKFIKKIIFMDKENKDKGKKIYTQTEKNKGRTEI